MLDILSSWGVFLFMENLEVWAGSEQGSIFHERREKNIRQRQIYLKTEITY